MTYDVLIVGGGMVGISLALALTGRGLKLGLIEAAKPGVDSQPNYDDRAIALAYGSRRVFDALDVWREIEPLAKRQDFSMKDVVTLASIVEKETGAPEERPRPENVE